jgi:hypothetical protein
MKKYTSKINGREFYIGDNLPNQIDGLPCFSLKEVNEMRGVVLSISELDSIFDKKLIIGATVESISKPHEEIGYDKKMPLERKELAKVYSETIRSMLKNKGAQ